jgi:hypothetical protein
MYIDKAEIIRVLRSRQLHDRADWVDKDLPELVDTHDHRALLEMLGVDPAAITPLDVASRQS